MNKAILILLLLLPLAVQAQSFSVFDIDDTNFPVIKAKFWAFDADGKQITNISPSDFEITEDCVQRDILNIYCPELQALQAISSVLTIDVSGSMSGRNLEMAKEAARTWIETMPLGKSECAITSFTFENLMVQDFTTDKSRLLEKLNTIILGGGTDFDAGFIDPMAGALITAEKGKHKRVLVFLTDGQSSGSENEIIQKANELEAQVFCITLGQECPKILRNIAEQTGGWWFENIIEVQQAKEIYLRILNVAQSVGACEIEWRSDYFCNTGKTNVNLELLPYSLIAESKYERPELSIAHLEFEPPYLSFKNPNPGEKIWQVVKVTAKNDDFKINDIIVNNQKYYIYPSNFTLKKGKSKDLQISYEATDSAYTYCKMEFQTDKCQEIFYASGGWTGVAPLVRTLELIHPNGNEQFIAGSDTIITWEGLTPYDVVSIDYSINNGQSWRNLADSAMGLLYNWSNVPLPASDSCLIKVSQPGEGLPAHSIEWQKCFGGSKNDWALSICQTDDGGYITFGYSESNDGDISENYGNYDYWVVKTDFAGNIQWQKNYGGSSLEQAEVIIQTLDGGYIITGTSGSNDGDVSDNHGNNDIWIVKLNKAGAIEWQKCYGGTQMEIIKDIVQTSDNGYIFAGFTYSNNGDVYGNHGSTDYWVVKIDSEGVQEWQKCLGGTNGDYANSIQQTKDGGYIVAGYTRSRDGDVSGYHSFNDFWVVKLTDAAEIEWQKCYGGYDDDIAYAVCQTKDSGYIVAGFTYSNDGDVLNNKAGNNIWILKLNTSGEIQWQKCYGGSEFDCAIDINETDDGGYIIAGESGSKDGDVDWNHGERDYWIIKLNENGFIEWQENLGGSLRDATYSVLQTSDKGYIIAGFTYSNDGDVSGNHGESDFWIVKLTPDKPPLQSDTSDAVFSIVAPLAEARNIDMGREIVGEVKDSLFVDFVVNTGSYKVRIDSIYFTGADSIAFAQVSAFPVYEIEVDKAQSTEFRFIPNRVGLHTAKLNIITQAATLEYDITGIGEERRLQIACDILDFGEVEITQEKTISDTVLIKNISAHTVNVTGVNQLGPDMEQFHIISGGEPFTLAPNGEHRMSLQFMPKYGGRTSGQLGFEYEGAGSPARVQLFGTGKGGLVYAADDSAYAGDRFNIKLMLGNVKPEGIAKIATDYEATIRFQRTLLAPSGSIDWQSTVDSIYITINGKIGNTVELSEIPVIACLGNTEETSIDVVEMNLLDESGNPIEYEFEKQSGIFTLLGICREGGSRLINPDIEAGIINISPNPAEKSLNIEISLIEEGYTELTISNSIGESVQSIFSANNETTGSNKFKADISNLANGVYYVILKTPNQHFIEKVLVIR